YVKRHSIQQWRTLRNMTAAATIVHPIVGGLGDLAAVGSVRAFSREHEREADLIGAELMRQAGYDLREVSRVWDALMREQEASGGKRPFTFFATHPPTPERAEMLRGLVRRRDYARSQVLLDRLLAGGAHPGELYSFQAEL